MGPTARYICNACGYRWTRTFPPMRGGKVIVLDVPFQVPAGPCCND